VKNRTLLIGLDGATFTILDSLMEEGEMPFLREFIVEGVRAELLSTVPPLTPPAWTSLVTGRRPGHHGIFDFFQKEEKSPHIRFLTSQDVHCETIWSIASRHGLRVTTLNFPLMLPPPALNGNVVSGGWMTWRQLRLGCYPDDLYDRLKTLPGFNAKELAMDLAQEEKAVEGCKREEYEDWIRMHIRREEQWFNILKHLMCEEPCDLTAILVDGVDKIQHLCWRFLAPDCASSMQSSWEERIRALCLEYFSKLDQLLAEIIELAGPETGVVMASDHGFGAQEETFFVNTWLQQNNYLTWAHDGVPEENESSVLGMGQLAKHVHMIDWDKTLAYTATPSSNGIHIVVAENNQEEGVTQTEYETFRRELIASLKSIVSPVTGEPLVRRIWTREEVFQGPLSHLAPDLTLDLRDGGLMSILKSDLPVKPRQQLSGTHRPEGIFIAKGPTIAKGKSIEARSILDVAPMLLYMLGIPVPEDMEGRTPEDAFQPWALEQRPIRKAGRSKVILSPEEEGRQRIKFDAEAEAEMAARLRSLGYIE
jgi:predicted AlkP superfamily phosphohydrolase/phosphomutase